jgi:hypothetical protein
MAEPVRVVERVRAAAGIGHAPPPAAAVTVFLQIFALAAACYVGMFARTQLLRSLRRRQRRRQWRALDSAATRGGSSTPAQPA